MIHYTVLVPWSKIYVMGDDGNLTTNMECFEWLEAHCGPKIPTGNRRSLAYDIELFEESEALWDYYMPGIGDQPKDGVVAFLFKQANDAMVFKLTWA